MERDELDLIAIGRSLITDPQWVDKVRSGNAAGLKDFEAASLAERV